MNAQTTLLRGGRGGLLALLIGLLVQTPAALQAQEWDSKPSPYAENNQIRRDKFDLILPQIMRQRGVDMWIHVMRVAVPDSFGADELGSTSGVFIFTDRGGGRIERAILERRWGASQREEGETNYKEVEESGAYDIIGDPVFVQEPVGGPMTEYDYRFKGLRAFVEARDPKRIAVNFAYALGPWVTYSKFEGDPGWVSGISHTDYLLLTKELGEVYASRLVSSEWLLMDYLNRPVPSEVAMMKKLRQDELGNFHKALAAIVPGVTKTRDTPLTVFRRMRTGLSQRGRSAGWEDAVVQGGDILAAPRLGKYAYVLRKGETSAPPEIQKLWAEYLKIDKIMVETIKSGLTPREIVRNLKLKFAAAGIIVRDNQLHMVQPKDNFPVYSAGFDPNKTELSIDSHGQVKGARPYSVENYLAPRIGTLGPDWTKDITLVPYHHFVLEYFFYMPSPAPEGQDQYLFWWNHEEALATEHGVEYLSPPQTELILIH